jgi:cytochrome c
MADLIAYLFAERYFEGTSSSEHGRRLFADKGCAGCHAPGSGTAPDLAHAHSGASPISIATALWNHGPMMYERMRERQIMWPRFAPGEIVDLMEFISHSQTQRLQSAAAAPQAERRAK